MKTTKIKSNQRNKIVTSRGADPECFIKDMFTGEIVSAIDLLQRGKDNPIDLGDEVTLYYDNCMAEFTIKPAFTRASFVQSFRDAFTKINKYIRENCGDNYKITIQASHEFDKKYLENPEALRVGCNPEFTCYSYLSNGKIEDNPSMITPPDFSGNLRSAGGHIAIGRKDFQKHLNSEEVLMGFDSKINLVKLLDYCVGVPFTLIDNDPTSLRRRKIYGSPSSHRPKDFGIEYRVLSCLWTSSPKTVELIYDLSEFAVELLLNNKHNKIFNKIDKNQVNACIRENNKGLAEEIIDAINLPKSLQVRLNQYKNIKYWDFYKEWELENVQVKSPVLV